MLSIGTYIDEQTCIVDGKTGELPPCLGRSYITYTESARRDLEALAGLSKRKKAPDLKKYIEVFGAK
jgi:hypothetical protein